MASYRPFPSQPPYLVPPPAPDQGTQYTQNWATPPGPPISGFNQIPNSNFHHSYPPQPPPHHQQYSYRPPPPPPETSYPPPPPPPSELNTLMSLQKPMYHPSASQYSQFGQIPALHPPPSPPQSSSIPPPPLKSPSSRHLTQNNDKATVFNESRLGSTRNHASLPPKHQKTPPGKNPSIPGRVETEEERRARKKREFEKQRQEEKQIHHMKASQIAVLQKAQKVASGSRLHGSISGRGSPFLTGDRVENRLKKPTTFVCKMKFWNELPDPTAQPKLTSLKLDKDRFTRYAITSLEKLNKPHLFVEPDLGIPLDLLDLSVYNPPRIRPPLDPEDEELLRDDELVTPVKKSNIKRKERPTDKGVSWLVKTQYISPLSMEASKQSMTEKQAKELRETKGGKNILDNFKSRERKIQGIEASFEACKSLLVHSTNKNLHPVEVMPLFPDFERFDDQFIVAAFDSAPTADSETFSKLAKPIRDEHESKAVMKSFVATGSDASNPDKFLAYMVPTQDGLSKDLYDENKDVSFSWVREYHWDVKGEDAADPTTYLLSLDDGEARYVPLSTKLTLRKKRAKEGRSSDEVEHYPAPSSVTVRRRETVRAVELKDPEVRSSFRGSVHLKNERLVDDDEGMDRSSGAEDEMSE